MVKNSARKQPEKRSRRLVKTPDNSSKTRAKRGIGHGRSLAAKSLVSIALGFDRCHPKVWHYMRESGVMYVGGHDPSRWARAQKHLALNRKIMVYAPKQQGGTGLLGIGTIVQSPVKFENGGKIVRTPLGDELIGYMRDVFSKPENQAIAPKKNLLSRSFKAQARWLDECGQRTCWQVGRRWLSDKHFFDYNQTQVPVDKREAAWTGAFRVKWEITVPFDRGLFDVDWCRHGASPARLSSLHSLTPRHFDDVQVKSMVLSLKAAGRGSDHGFASPERHEEVHKVFTAVGGAKTNKGTGESSCAGNCAGGKAAGCEQSLEKVPVGYADVAELLTKCNLQQYLPCLVGEEVNLIALKLLSDADLKSIGIPLGPRRILQAALVSNAF